MDLTKWTEQAHGPVEITRHDRIRKVSGTREDYVVPYFTTGDGISSRFLSYTSQPEFIEDPQPGFAGKHYLYKLHLGDQPKDFTELVSTAFTFSTGFKDPAKEWWQASIAYPSKTVSVVIQFPNGKPCKTINAFIIRGIRGDKQPISNNEPVISNEGGTVTWAGLNIDGNTRIEFDWGW